MKNLRLAGVAAALLASLALSAQAQQKPWDPPTLTAAEKASGKQQLIAGLEDKLKGKEAGFQGRIEMPPEQGYGPYRPELVFEAVRENLPANLDIQPGMDLSPGGSAGKFNLKVVALTERGDMLDGNHRFAGKHLLFDVEVIRVDPATESSDASTSHARHG